MNTPICDFVKKYAGSNMLRLHMPGHKGFGPLGVEGLDITEISGADSLYEAEGIIRESEHNASMLFGCDTFYSTEGSSQCIRAMIYLAWMHGKKRGRKPLVYAARNAHKTFLSAAALLDLEVEWLLPGEEDSYLSCRLEAEKLDEKLSCAKEARPFAVYITSPDYLGNMADVKALAKVCRKHAVLLLVDNAHGAYLRFLPVSRHPMDLGADICCDSAHKTLPVLTGGAYLHLSNALSGELSSQAKNALALFGSTSPSYLILQSLDAANALLDDSYRNTLAEFIPFAQACRDSIEEHGFKAIGDEPLKLTIETKASMGWVGSELAARLRSFGIECEFADPDYVVLMLTPEIGSAGLRRLEQAITSLKWRNFIGSCAPVFRETTRAMGIREAMLSASESVEVENSIGRILALPSVGCPPAVPILVCGERIDEHTIECFRYYGVAKLCVIKEA